MDIFFQAGDEDYMLNYPVLKNKNQFKYSSTNMWKLLPSINKKTEK